MGNSPRDCGPGGQWLGFIFIWWGIVLMGSCPRTSKTSFPKLCPRQVTVNIVLVPINDLNSIHIFYLLAMCFCTAFLSHHRHLINEYQYRILTM